MVCVEQVPVRNRIEGDGTGDATLAALLGVILTRSISSPSALWHSPPASVHYSEVRRRPVPPSGQGVRRTVCMPVTKLVSGTTLSPSADWGCCPLLKNFLKWPGGRDRRPPPLLI